MRANQITLLCFEQIYIWNTVSSIDYDTRSHTFSYSITDMNKCHLYLNSAKSVNSRRWSRKLAECILTLKCVQSPEKQVSLLTKHLPILHNSGGYQKYCTGDVNNFSFSIDCCWHLIICNRHLLGGQTHTPMHQGPCLGHPQWWQGPLGPPHWWQGAPQAHCPPSLAVNMTCPHHFCHQFQRSLREWISVHPLSAGHSGLLTCKACKEKQKIITTLDFQNAFSL